MLNVATDRALRTPHDVVALVEAVTTASDVDETVAIEWKSTLDLSTKPGVAHVVRAILGLANRMPNVAQRYFGGCGYVIVGAEPRSVRGIEPMDNAQLHDKLAPYLGVPGPNWTPEWPRVDGKSVLVIVVDPPVAGDTIWKLRKNLDGHESGRVWVRRPGKTEPASAEDLDALEERARQRSDRLDVVIEHDGPLVAGVFEPDDGAIERWLKDRRAALLAPLDMRRTLRESERAAKFGLSGAAVYSRAFANPDGRSEAQYTSEVNAYINGLGDPLWEYVTLGALDAAPRLVLTLSNQTDRNFTAVQVVLEFHGPVLILDEDDLDRTLPEPPRAYGTVSPMLFDRYIPEMQFHRGLLHQAQAVMRPEITHRSGEAEGAVVEFPSVGLRPHARLHLDRLAMLVPPDAEGPLTIECTATATNANGRAANQLVASVTPLRMTTRTLLPPIDDEDQ